MNNKDICGEGMLSFFVINNSDSFSYEMHQQLG